MSLLSSCFVKPCSGLASWILRIHWASAPDLRLSRGSLDKKDLVTINNHGANMMAALAACLPVAPSHHLPQQSSACLCLAENSLAVRQ